MKELIQCTLKDETSSKTSEKNHRRKKQVGRRKNGCTVNIVDNGRAQPHMHKTWQNWREEKPVFFNNLVHVAISTSKRWFKTGCDFEDQPYCLTAIQYLSTKTVRIQKKTHNLVKHWESGKEALDGLVVKADRAPSESLRKVIIIISIISVPAHPHRKQHHHFIYSHNHTSNSLHKAYNFPPP